MTNEELSKSQYKRLKAQGIIEDKPISWGHENDLISRQAAIDEVLQMVNDHKDDKFGGALIHYTGVIAILDCLPSAQSELEEKIKAIGLTGKEGRIYIGGRLFAVRELAQ